MSVLRRVGFTCSIILFGMTESLPVMAQFKVEPKSDFFSLNEDKRLEFYSPMRYNRGEGWFPAVGLTLKPTKSSGLSFSVDGGYGIDNKKARFNLGFEYQWPIWRIFKLGGKYFDDTFTNDEWLIGGIENSFAAFLLREDFHDYFGAKGFTVWSEKEYGEWLHFRLAYWFGDYTSMAKKTNWSVFGGHKKFHGNPAIIEGQEHKLRFEWIIDRLDNPIFPMQGWYLEGALEKGGDFLGGDFKQSGIFMTGKYFRRSFGNQRMVFVGRYGRWQDRSFSPQHLLDLGGIGTLRGYRFKEFQDGQNLCVGSWQYYFNGDLLQKLPLQWIPFYKGLDMILFAEVGALWDNDVPPQVYTTYVDHPEWKWDVGFSLSFTGDFIRLDFAKRLDRSDNTWAITFRVLPRL